MTHQPILSVLSAIVEAAVKLHKDGHRVVIVSSGAIAVGLRRMDIEKKPKALAKIQVQRTSSYAFGFIPAHTSTGSSSCWTMPIDQLLGQPIRTLAPANRPDPSHEE